MRTSWISLMVVAAAACASPAVPVVTPPAQPSYRLLATAESDDQVALIRFIPCRAPGRPAGCGAQVERTYQVGLWPAETEGPHGVVPSHDGRSFYVTLAHGRPFGYLQKISLATGEQQGLVTLGMFPATVAVAPRGSVVYAINFNFEDPAVGPSSLSVVDGETMTELARPVTCRMPHGSRVNPAGTRHYSACMMNDLLVEVDALGLGVTRAFDVAPGREGPVAPDQLARAMDATGAPGGHDDVSHLCSPTWAEPSADGAQVYLACNRSGEIVEVDVAGWRMTRRWKTPPAPYNLAATADGRLLVATQKGPGTITVWRLADGAKVAEIPGTRRVASGVTTSSDSRYAFVTLEGVGGEPGTVDVIDLSTLTKVASVDMGKQAGGIAMLP